MTHRNFEKLRSVHLGRPLPDRITADYVSGDMHDAYFLEFFSDASHEMIVAIHLGVGTPTHRVDVLTFNRQEVVS